MPFALGKIHRAVRLVDTDAADFAAIDAGFVGDRADDAARTNSVALTDGQPKTFHPR